MQMLCPNRPGVYTSLSIYIQELQTHLPYMQLSRPDLVCTRSCKLILFRWRSWNDSMFWIVWDSILPMETQHTPNGDTAYSQWRHSILPMETQHTPNGDTAYSQWRHSILPMETQHTPNGLTHFFIPKISSLPPLLPQLHNSHWQLLSFLNSGFSWDISSKRLQACLDYFAKVVNPQHNKPFLSENPMKCIKSLLLPTITRIQ